MALSGDIFSSIQFIQPGWLWLLPVLMVAALLCQHYCVKEENNTLVNSPAAKGWLLFHPLLSLLPRPSVSARGTIGRSVIFWLLMALMVVALSQPVRIGEKLPNPTPQRNIVFIVDTSVSMLLRDYVLDGERIDRMAMLKAVLNEFIQELDGDRVSIIVFADKAHTFVPFTEDLDLAQYMLLRIETGMVGRSNAVGDAIAFSIKQLKTQQVTQPLFMLFTDMNRSIGKIEPEAATQLLKAEGWPLYTVAIGSASYQAEERRSTGLIYEPVNLALLNNMAKQTGANSYHASDYGALKQAVADINSREKSTVAVSPRYYQQPLYHWPLALAMLSLLAYQLLSNLRRGKA